MSAIIPVRRQRRACAGRTVPTALTFLTALAFVLASHTTPALAQAGAQSTPQSSRSSSHGTGFAPFLLPTASSEPITLGPTGATLEPDDLTGHGYRLMTLMGKFYREAQGDKGLPVDCSEKLRLSTRTRLSGRSPLRVR